MEELTLAALLERIQSDDPQVRTDAWQAAGMINAPALIPLAMLAGQADLEVARAARRAMWKIVRTAGAPGGDDMRPKVNEDLLALLQSDRPVGLKREVLWMLSEIACGDCATEPVSKLLADEDLREDARCCLERIPGDQTLAALKAALDSVPDSFKLAIAQSLRKRGVEVSEEKYPCQKLVPTRTTAVVPAGRG